MVRSPAVAGQFYPGNERALKQKIKDCFIHEFGPGKVPEVEGDERSIKGLVVPHAGYQFSGPVAAHAFSALYEDGMPETAVIMGPNHRSFSSGVAIADEDFQTPLGTAEVNKDLVEKVSGGVVEVNNRAQSGEHSIEVQVPFLQYISDDIKIVPICLNRQDYGTAEELGRRISKGTEGEDVVVIASTDFSHHVPQNVAEKKDKMAIDKILENDPKGLIDVVQKENISMCGYGPVIAMMIGSGGEKGELLKYATSGDMTPMKEVVGYGAISFK